LPRLQSTPISSSLSPVASSFFSFPPFSPTAISSSLNSTYRSLPPSLSSSLFFSFSFSFLTSLPSALSSSLPFSIHLRSSSSAASPESWPEKVAHFLGRQPPHFQEAVDYLETIWPSLPDQGKVTASACLAFFYHQLKAKNDEYHWLSLHFEKYPSSFWDYAFLPPPWEKKLLKYLNYWEKTYPQLYDLAFFKPPQSPLEKWPASLTLVISVKAEAFYKIFQDNSPVAGGKLKPGPNLVKIPLPDFAPQITRTIPFLLEFKKDDLIISYQVDLNQTLETTTNRFSLQPPQVKSRKLKLSLYWQNKMLAQSEIIQDLKEEITKNLPPRDGLFLPFGPYREKGDPTNSGVSVFQALQLLGNFLQKKLSSEQKSGSRLHEGKKIISLSQITPDQERELKFLLRSYSSQISGQTTFHHGRLNLKTFFKEGKAFSLEKQKTILP